MPRPRYNTSSPLLLCLPRPLCHQAGATTVPPSLLSSRRIRQPPNLCSFPFPDPPRPLSSRSIPIRPDLCHPDPSRPSNNLHPASTRATSAIVAPPQDRPLPPSITSRPITSALSPPRAGEISPPANTDMPSSPISRPPQLQPYFPLRDRSISSHLSLPRSSVVRRSDTSARVSLTDPSPFFRLLFATAISQSQS